MSLDPRARRLLDMLSLGGGPRPIPMSAAERRAGFAALMAMARPAAVPGRVEAARVQGAAGLLPARVYIPAEAGGGHGAGLVFFHGGGLVAGDLDTHDGLCRRLAADSGVRIVAVAYRLAPEHRFPAAVEDAVASTRQVMADAPRFGIDPGRLGVGGDSAGGTLATLAAGACRERLRAQLLLCPVLDLDARRPSRLAYGEGYMLDQAIMDRDLADYLTPGQDAADPRVSPIYRHDLAGLPATLIHTASHDPLGDEGRDYAAALAVAGVPVRHTDHAGMIHHFLGLEGVLPAARPALAAIGAELRAALA